VLDRTAFFGSRKSPKLPTGKPPTKPKPIPSDLATGD
jgi:hypothetical protein